MQPRGTLDLTLGVMSLGPEETKGRGFQILYIMCIMSNLDKSGGITRAWSLWVLPLLRESHTIVPGKCALVSHEHTQRARGRETKTNWNWEENKCSWKTDLWKLKEQ